MKTVVEVHFPGSQDRRLKRAFHASLVVMILALALLAGATRVRGFETRRQRTPDAGPAQARPHVPADELPDAVADDGSEIVGLAEPALARMASMPAPAPRPAARR